VPTPACPTRGASWACGRQDDAAGGPWRDPPAGAFAAGARGSEFYAFGETAACHGSVSGYACGGPGEPCDDPHRAYFRQTNNVTRGQIAKIGDGVLTSGQGCVLHR
jgi:hypothetical protein